MSAGLNKWISAEMKAGEEYIDIISPDGKLTGISKPRSEIHQKGTWHRSVHIWVLNDREELLIQKRSLEKESHPGLWDVSCAGHIQSGDSSLLAAVRECKEELGLDVQPEELTLMFTSKSHFILNSGTYIDNEFIDVYLVKKEVDLQTLQLQPGEVSAVKMIPVDEFRECVASRNALFVPHWEAYQKLLDCLDNAIR